MSKHWHQSGLKGRNANFSESFKSNERTFHIGKWSAGRTKNDHFYVSRFTSKFDRCKLALVGEYDVSKFQANFREFSSCKPSDSHSGRF